MNNNAIIQSLYGYYLTSSEIATDSRNIPQEHSSLHYTGTFSSNKFAEEALQMLTESDKN